MTTIGTMGRRVYAGDLQEGFFYLRHKKADNKLYPFAEVVGSRYVTAGLVLDYDTVAGADKFGNFFINRLPADVSAEVGLPGWMWNRFASQIMATQIGTIVMSWLTLPLLLHSGGG